jgi:nicotinate-nucleotide pyrophosphorylase (carboxylating)
MLKKIIETALKEDDVLNDITSDLTIAKNNIVTFEIAAREKIIFCGVDVILEVFSQLKSSAKFKNTAIELDFFASDGDVVNSGKPIIRGHGNAKLIFAAERVMLNLIQHLSGVATNTQNFVKALNDKKITILDTRKTLPSLRELEKYAVLCGGGKNHRFSLSDMILIKDNHIAAAGSVKKAIAAAKKSDKKIEIECDNSKQVAEAVLASPDIIMLDNMSAAELKKSIALIKKSKKKIEIEVSGGVNLENIKNFSGLAIDFISIGSLTHSARAVDIGLDINHSKK